MTNNDLFWYRDFLATMADYQQPIYFDINDKPHIKNIISNIFYNHEIECADSIHSLYVSTIPCYCYEVSNTDYINLYSNLLAVYFSKKSLDFLKELNDLYGDLV